MCLKAVSISKPPNRTELAPSFIDPPVSKPSLRLATWLVNADDGLRFERFDGGLQDSLSRETVGAGAVDLLRRHAFAHLLEKEMNAVAERVLEIAHAAENRVGVDPLDQVPGGVERRLAPHVVDDQTPARPPDLTAFHRVAALDLIGGSQPADRAVLEAHAEVGGRPDGTLRRVRGLSLIHI